MKYLKRKERKQQADEERKKAQDIMQDKRGLCKTVCYELFVGVILLAIEFFIFQNFDAVVQFFNQLGFKFG